MQHVAYISCELLGCGPKDVGESYTMLSRHWLYVEMVFQIATFSSAAVVLAETAVSFGPFRARYCTPRATPATTKTTPTTLKIVDEQKQNVDDLQDRRR